MGRFQVSILVVLAIAVSLNLLARVHELARDSSPSKVVLNEIDFALSPIANADLALDTSLLVAASFNELTASLERLRSRIGSNNDTASVRFLDSIIANAQVLRREFVEHKSLNNIQLQELRNRLKRVVSIISQFEEDSVPPWKLFLLNVGAFTDKIFTWPFIVFVLVLFVFLNKITVEKVTDFLHPLKSIQLFGASVELGSNTKTKSEDSIKEMRREVQKKFDIASRKLGIRRKLEQLYNQELTDWSKKPGNNLPRDIRITLHVPDLLFDETLYQLVDYYPAGGGRGRIFSVRYGIIGLAWRLKETQINGSIPTDSNELIRGWGMTSAQASSAGDGRKSMIAYYIEGQNGTVGEGILFIDSKDENAFGQVNPPNSRDERATDLLESLKGGIERLKLVADLSRLREELVADITEIRIYEP